MERQFLRVSNLFHFSHILILSYFFPFDSHAWTSFRPPRSSPSLSLFHSSAFCFFLASKHPSVSCPVWSALPALIILLLSQCTRMLVFYYDSLLLVFFLNIFSKFFGYLSRVFHMPAVRSVFYSFRPSRILQSTLINGLLSTS